MRGIAPFQEGSDRPVDIPDGNPREKVMSRRAHRPAPIAAIFARAGFLVAESTPQKPHKKGAVYRTAGRKVFTCYEAYYQEWATHEKRTAMGPFSKRGP